MYRLIAMDLDGTLNNDEKRITLVKQSNLSPGESGNLFPVPGFFLSLGKMRTRSRGASIPVIRDVANQTDSTTTRYAI